MKPGTPQFVGERLTEAREARELTVIALAGLLDVRRESIYQFESGKITPGPLVFKDIQHTLRMPASYFLDPIVPADAAEVRFRSLASSSKLARRRAARRLEWLDRLTLFVKQYVALPAFDMPNLTEQRDPTRLTDEDVEAAALRLREEWSLGLGPISNVTWLLENHGFIVAREELGAADMDAALRSSPIATSMLLASDKRNRVRSRMDAVHEAGHAGLHRFAPTPRNTSDPLHKLMERQAFDFAGAFLMPAESFAWELNRCDLDSFLAIKPKWQVSVAAMIMRATAIGMISEDQKGRLFAQMARRGWRRTEPFDDEWEPEAPNLLRQSFELILQNGRATIDQALDAIKLTPTDIEDLGSLSGGTLSTSVIPLEFRRGGESNSTLGEIVPFVRKFS